MTRYVSGANRTFWTLSFRVTSWSLLYCLWPFAFIVFAALSADGRFRSVPVKVFNCTIVNDLVAQVMGIYPRGSELFDVFGHINGTNFTKFTPAYMMVRRPFDTPDFLGNSSAYIEYSRELLLSNCSVERVLPAGDIYNATAAIGTLGPNAVSVLACIIVGALFLVSALAYALPGNFQRAGQHDNLACFNKFCLLLLWTSCFDIVLNCLCFLGLSLLVLFPTGAVADPTTVDAHYLCVPLYLASALIGARPVYRGISYLNSGNVEENAIPANIAVFVLGVILFIQVPVLAEYLNMTITRNILTMLSPTLIGFSVTIVALIMMYVLMCHELRNGSLVDNENMAIIATYYTAAAITATLLICATPFLHFLNEQMADPNALATGDLPRTWVTVCAPLMAFVCIVYLVWLADKAGDGVWRCKLSCEACRKSAIQRTLEAKAAALRTSTPAQEAAIARRAAKLAAQSAEAEKAAAQNAEDKVSNVPWVPADEEDPESAAVETSESSPKAVATDTPAASQADKSEKRKTLKPGTRIKVTGITDTRFMVRNGILLGSQMHNENEGRVHDFNKETGRYSIVLGTHADRQGAYIAVLPENVQALHGKDSKLSKLLQVFGYDAAQSAAVDEAELAERRERLRAAWRRELESLVEARNSIALRLSLLALAKQLDDNPAELRTDENRWLLVQAAELYIGHSADHAKYWDDAIKLNYARVLRRFTGAAQLLVAAQATGGDIANPNVPFPGSPPKP